MESETLTIWKTENDLDVLSNPCCVVSATPALREWVQPDGYLVTECSTVGSVSALGTGAPNRFNCPKSYAFPHFFAYSPNNVTNMFFLKVLLNGEHMV